MSELRQHHPVQGRRHTTVGGSLVLEALPDEARFSLRVDAGNLPACTNAFHCDLAEHIGGAAGRHGRRSLALGPDEWFLLAPENDRDAIATAFAALGSSVSHSLVDVGHRTVAIRIAGPGARDALNSGCPLDLTAIPVGGCTRSVFHKAEFILLRLGEDDFRLEVVRSFADYVWSMLERAMDAVGSDV